MSDRIDNIVRRGIVTSIYDAGDVMRLDLTAKDGEALTGVPYSQPRGVSASPCIGDIVLVICEGGDTESAEAWCVLDKKNRPRGLGAGEMALFNEGRTGFVLIGSDGRILLLSGQPGNYQSAIVVKPDGLVQISGTEIIIDAPKIRIAGVDVQINGTQTSINATNAQLNTATASIASAAQLQISSSLTAILGGALQIQTPVASSVLPPVTWPTPPSPILPSHSVSPDAVQKISEKSLL